MTTKKKPQKERIKAFLLSGGKLTALEALKRFKCFRLASRISELRESYKVNVEMVRTKGGARIARYSIPV